VDRKPRRFWSSQIEESLSETVCKSGGKGGQRRSVARVNYIDVASTEALNGTMYLNGSGKRSPLSI
jgi:hypothetical protein